MRNARATLAKSSRPGLGTAVPLLLHVGYHKTGSTWLQNLIFSRPQRGFTTDTGRPRHRIAQDFVRPDIFHFDADATRASYEPYLRKAREAGLTLVISHERLSGYPASGSYDRRLIADRLASVFAPARVLIVLREQVSLIRSMYNQYITDGGDQPLHSFLSCPEPQLGRMPYFRFEVYEFDRLIGYYRSLFGSNNVLVLPYEMLVQAPNEFLAHIGCFCGRDQEPLTSAVRVNERRPMLMQATQRLLNRYFSRNELSPTTILPIARLPKRVARLRPLFDRFSPRVLEGRLDRRLHTRIASAVGLRYAASNTRTSRMIGLDLAAYGYPVDPTEVKIPEMEQQCGS